MKKDKKQIKGFGTIFNIKDKTKERYADYEDGGRKILKHGDVL